ncbi:MAG: hypothetical protein R3B57_05560 [Phycisphaerales bacterium]
MAPRFDEHELGEGLDPDGPSAEDLDRFGDETVTCPHCGAEVWDQHERCNACGERLTDPPKGSPPMPMWAWITLFVAILLVLAWVL